ncbi:DUF6768 family protein [Pseudoruegeria sp. HB172150]|uniref:DUF6768 family protein n=1 Tax=Pseudoruegeria sp. HB172150 TaxID=2721164 RepID=UPI001554E7DE|nr:DUF6768 family protein [Pseudoruegeria sp. HB172150]
MTERLDKLIEEALRAEDSAIWEATQEKGYFALGMSLFRGRLGWMTWVIMVVQTVMFLAGAWCAVRFFGTTDVLMALRWGLSATVLFILATQLKLSLMPQLQAERILRELKRVELMLAQKE